MKLEEIFTLENLYKAAVECEKSVSWKESVQRFCNERALNIIKLHESLLSGTYRLTKYYEFTIKERGKVRHIKALSFKDRVMQRCLLDSFIVSNIYNKLIYDCGASLKNRGIKFAKDRCAEHLRRYYRKNGPRGYVLKIDIKSYFDNVDHEILKDKFRKYVDDERVLKIITDIIDSYGKGIGLGSQLCQTAGLLYLNDLDHIIKDKWKIKGYGRYMDDMYVICKTRKDAEAILDSITKYLQTIKLQPNKKKTKITMLTHGFVFLKTVFSLTKTGKVIQAMETSDSMRKTKRKLAVCGEEGVKAGMKGYINQFNCYKRFKSFCKRNKLQLKYSGK